MIGEIFNAKDYSLKPKATIQQTGKTGFNAENLFMKAGTILYEEHLKTKDNITIPGSILTVPYIPGVSDPVTEEENEIKRKKGCIC